MTENKDYTKTKKLTLPSKMMGKVLNKVSFRDVTYNNRSIKVEIKNKNKGGDSSIDATRIKMDSQSNGLTEDEFNTRINVLKKAESEKLSQEYFSEQIDKSSSIKKEENIQSLEKIISDEKDNKVETVDDSQILENKKSNSNLENANKITTNTIIESIKVDLTDKNINKLDKPEKEIKSNKLSSKSIDKPISKLKKSDNFSKANKVNLLNRSEDDDIKTRSLASIRRAKEKEKRKLEQVSKDKIYREVTLGDSITVSDLASRMSEKVVSVIKELLKLGVVSNANQSIDYDTAELVVTSLGHFVKKEKESDIENVLALSQGSEEYTEPKIPIVTVMGHVDHGKTSLLDALKSTDIVAKESGGITQHIGAYMVNLPNGKAITFIDTPGHEAFTDMRIRGAQVTDMVILVVAADDGIKAQTIEAINHAKAAEVPIIVAINKIDKEAANITKVKNELLSHGLVPEELGGDIIVVPVSAAKKLNLDKLEEAILLMSQILELKTSYKSPASGVIIEAKVDKNSGVVVTILLQHGTLKIGDIILAGESFGKVKKMINDKGKSVKEIHPSEPVQVLGLSQIPKSGDKISLVSSEKKAKDIIDYRIRKNKDSQVNSIRSNNLKQLIKQGGNKVKELAVIIKSDVHGSLEAILGSLNKIVHDEVTIRIIHSAVGGINESDITLAKASNALVIGFNVRANAIASAKIDQEKVEVKYYSIIYSLIDDIKDIVTGMISPVNKEEIIGTVEIRQIFNITKVGKIAGCYVTKGIAKRGSRARIIRDNLVIFDGVIKTLKHLKDNVTEVRKEMECGIEFNNYTDFKINDIIEVYNVTEVKRSLSI